MTLRRSFYLSFGRTGGQTFIQFATNIVIARLLPPEEVGVYVVALAAVLTLGAIREFGIPRYLVKESEVTEAKLSTAFGVSILIGWSLAAAIYLGRHAADRFYDTQPGAPAHELAAILSVLSLTFLILPIGQPALAMLRRNQCHDQLTAGALCAALGGSATSITFAVLDFGAISMAYGLLVSTVLASGFALYFEPAHLRLRPSLLEWRSVMGFGSVATTGSIVVQLNQHTPALLLGRLLGFAEAGLFQRAHSLSYVVLGLIVTSANWVTGVAMGARYRSGEDMSVLALRTTDYLAVIGWPVLAILALKSQAVILALYGLAWLPAASVLPPLCIAAAISIVASQATAVYEGTGAAGMHLRNHSIALVIATILIFVGAQFGLVAVAWMRVPAVAAMSFLHFSALRRYAGISLGQMMLALMPALLVTIGVSIAQLGLIMLEPEDSDWKWSIILAAELSVVGVVYILLVFALKHPIRHELRHVAAALVGRFRGG